MALESENWNDLHENDYIKSILFIYVQGDTKQVNS